MPKLSEHFTYEELTRTDVRDLDNTPDAISLAKLQVLADFLEKARTLWGCGVRVYSGYRSPEVNTRIGGAKTSQHMKGEAADTFPLGMEIRQAFELLRDSDLPYDQIIYERPNPKNTGWIHISYVDYRDPRRQALSYERIDGVLAYRPYSDNLV